MGHTGENDCVARWLELIMDRSNKKTNKNKKLTTQVISIYNFATHSQ